MTFKKLILKIHLWLGLGSGLIIFILGITGCIYVFDEELRPIFYHNSYYADEIKAEKKPLSSLLAIAQNAIGKDKPITDIRMKNKKDATVQFFTYKNNENKNAIWYWDTHEYSYIVAVNPYSGKVQEVKNTTTEFFEVIVWLHWSLLLTNDIGQPIVGIAVLIFVISLLTGLVLWWPKNKSAAKQRFWFKWKNTTQWKRKNYDLHNILGFYSIVFALLIAFTGLVWAFDWFEDTVKWTANGGETIKNEREEIKSDVSKMAQFPVKPVDKIYATIVQKYPHAKYYQISMPEDSVSSQFVYVENDGSFEKTSIDFDQYSGKLLQTKNFSDKSNGDKIRSLNYDIHSGAILGLPGKILAFFASFICASLPVTGFYIWWGRNNKKAKKKK